MAVRVAVDVGGTFTDICVFDEQTGTVEAFKVASTADPLVGVLEGVEKAQVDLSEAVLFSHGTTVATNALITRTLPRAAMVTTKGFRDVIEIRRGTKQDLWDAYKDVAPPYIERRDRFVVTERIDYQGYVITPIDEDEAREVARKLRARRISTVAVCFINSFANPANEQRMKAILEAELNGATITTSSEVVREIFEHERFSTTVANAMLTPLIDDYLGKLDDQLAARGYEGDVVILHSGGGVMTPRVAQRFAVRLVGSGIAAGALASRYIADVSGFHNAIGLDMGGTSCDISLTYGGEMRMTNEWFIEFGYPISFPSIDVTTIGAGGGSIAWIDEGGSLRNGPQSAGADPGPACYARGNEEPSNTDANLVLGRLGDHLLGGDMKLDRSLAERAVQKIATPLGLSMLDAASAIVEVANANMADALRLISVRRGYDPRDFVLVVFGGAGPLHGAALAAELSIPLVLVPPNPGITSALGCLLVDVRHDLSTMFMARVDEVNVGEIEIEFQNLEAEATARLEAEGVSDEQRWQQRAIDMRYLGQWRSLRVPVNRPMPSLDELVSEFHELHEREHNYRREDAPVELHRLTVTAIGETPKPAFTRHTAVSADPVPLGTRNVKFDGPSEPYPTPVFARADLAPGSRIVGPAVIDQPDSTVVVPPGVRANVDEWMNLRLKVGDTQ